MSPLTFRTGRYGRYLTLISDIVYFLALNLAYWLTLWCTDAGREFSSRTVWLLLNLILLVLTSWRRRQGYNRSATMERVLNLAVRTLLLHAMLFLPALYLLNYELVTWRTLLAFYGWFGGSVLTFAIIMQLLLHGLRARGFNTVAVVIVGRPAGRAPGQPDAAQQQFRLPSCGPFRPRAGAREHPQ